MFEHKIKSGSRRQGLVLMVLRTLGVLFLLILSLSSCVIARPVMCFGASEVTPEKVMSIKQFSASIASEYDLRIVDNSDKYPSRNIDKSETLGIEIGSWDAKLVILSSGQLTPTLCFYGSTDSAELHLLIERFVSHLSSLEFELTMKNDNSVNALPIPIQEIIRKAVH